MGNLHKKKKVTAKNTKIFFPSLYLGNFKWGRLFNKHWSLIPATVKSLWTKVSWNCLQFPHHNQCIPPPSFMLFLELLHFKGLGDLPNTWGKNVCSCQWARSSQVCTAADTQRKGPTLEWAEFYFALKRFGFKEHLLSPFTILVNTASIEGSTLNINKWFQWWRMNYKISRGISNIIWAHFLSK